MASKLRVIPGDLFARLIPENVPSKKTIIFIPHICNNIGGWGSGFVVALSNWNRTAENDYRQYCRETETFALEDPGLRLGKTVFSRILVNDNLLVVVANMIAQHLTGTDEEGLSCIRYCALAHCMTEVRKNVLSAKMREQKPHVEIYSPRFGSGLAGGSQVVIESMIKEVWATTEVPITIYEK